MSGRSYLRSKLIEDFIKFGMNDDAVLRPDACVVAEIIIRRLARMRRVSTTDVADWIPYAAKKYSGSPEITAESLARRLGFDEAAATRASQSASSAPISLDRIRVPKVIGLPPARRERMAAEDGARRLRIRLDRIDQVRLRALCLGAMSEGMVALSQIVRASRPLPVDSYIYFLIEEDEVVYVGQSMNLLARIGQHLKDKKFSRMSFMKCAPEMLDFAESLYIYALKPKLNGSAPISLGQMVKWVEERAA